MKIVCLRKLIDTIKRKDINKSKWKMINWKHITIKTIIIFLIIRNNIVIIIKKNKKMIKANKITINIIMSTQ
jgi:hypothetical protein